MFLVNISDMLVLVKVAPFAQISSARDQLRKTKINDSSVEFFCSLTSTSLFCIKVDIGHHSSPTRITSFNVNSVFLGKLRNWLERLIELNLSGLNSGEIAKGIRLLTDSKISSTVFIVSLKTKHLKNWHLNIRLDLTRS